MVAALLQRAIGSRLHCFLIDNGLMRTGEVAEVKETFERGLEIPLNVHTYKSKHDTAGSFFTGLFTGIVKGTARTSVGFYEVVTCFLPYPEDFAPVLPTLEYFQQDTARKRLPGE